MMSITIIIHLLLSFYVVDATLFDCSSAVVGSSDTALVQGWDITLGTMTTVRSTSFPFTIAPLHPHDIITYTSISITSSFTIDQIDITYNMMIHGYNVTNATLKRKSTTMYRKDGVNTENVISSQHYLYAGTITINNKDIAFYCWSQTIQTKSELMYDTNTGVCEQTGASTITGVPDGARLYNTWPLAMIRATKYGICTFLGNPSMNEGDTFYPILRDWDLSGSYLPNARLIWSTAVGFNWNGCDLSEASFVLYGLQPSTGLVDKFTQYPTDRCKLCNNSYIMCNDNGLNLVCEDITPISTTSITSITSPSSTGTTIIIDNNKSQNITADATTITTTFIAIVIPLIMTIMGYVA